MDLSKIKDLKDLQALLDLMGRYNLSEIELEGEGQKIRLRKAEAAPAIAAARGDLVNSLAPTGAAPAGSGASFSTAAPQPAALPANLREVKSPMVGTFYRASSPEAEPFVKEGDHVEVHTVLCIIEAMKVMNEIPAEVSGVVREIRVKNGESVEFGQALFLIEVE